MKKTFLLTSIFICNIAACFSQGIMDAYKYSQKEMIGTARFSGMGGAMGAIGNDISAITVNPAGIGLYRQANEIVTTLDVSSTDNKTFMGGIDTDKRKTNFRFNNLAYTGSINLWNDAVPYLNIGFAYNRQSNFDNTYIMQGAGYGPSLSWLMADRANEYNPSPNSLLLSANNTSGNIGVWGSNSWLPILGYNSGMISSNAKNEYAPSSSYFDNPQYKYLKNREKGSVSAYDFNVGAEIEKVLSVGLSFTVTDLNYHLSSLYGEDFASNNQSQDGYFDMSNFLKTEGTGYQVSLGFLAKPIEYLSLGVAYHSPTWYHTTDYALVNFQGDFNIPGGKNFNLTSYEGADSETKYKLRTPDRWVFSAAGNIHGMGRNLAIVAVDYELTNNRGMKLENREWNTSSYGADNQEIKDYFRMSSTLRIGTEIAFTPQLFGRLGYSWQQSGMKDFVNDQNHPVYTAGTTTQFVVPGDTNYLTWGFGYRSYGGFFTDLAFIYKEQKNKLYSTSLADPVELKSNNYQGVFTIGYRFAAF